MNCPTCKGVLREGVGVVPCPDCHGTGKWVPQVGEEVLYEGVVARVVGPDPWNPEVPSLVIWPRKGVICCVMVSELTPLPHRLTNEEIVEKVARETEGRSSTARTFADVAEDAARRTIELLKEREGL